MLVDAERRLTRWAASTDDDGARRLLVQADLIGAHWKILHGRDPSALLHKAEVAIRDAAQRKADWLDEITIAYAYEAALWAHRAGRSAAREVQPGLLALERSLTAEPRNAMLWVQKAQLQALAGDRVDARTSLERGAARNQLVRGTAGRSARVAPDRTRHYRLSNPTARE